MIPKYTAVAFVSIWLGLAAANLTWFYTRPPIYTFNIFIGYMNGAVYDPLIRIHAEWAHFRIWSVGLAAGWLLAAHIGGKNRKLGCVLGTSVLISAMWLTSTQQLTAEQIEHRLGGRYETDHFLIIYDKQSAIAKRIDAIATDHEFRYQQLQHELGVEPSGKITSFVYANPEQKQRLMGAGRTYIAKPWSRMVHLNNLFVGATVLKHELAHVFGARINDGWLGIPTVAGILPQMALVEGFAVAYEPARGRLTPHQWSAAMRQLGIAPPLSRLLSSWGFLAAGSSKAYTLAGSFIRYLHDTYGTKDIVTLYGSGSFERAFNTPLLTLIRDWEAFVDDPQQVQLTKDDLALAQWQFDIPSRFHRVCALEIAEWEHQAKTAAHEGDFDGAVRLLETVYSFDKSIDKQLQLLHMLIRSRQLERGLDIAEALASDEQVGSVFRARGLHASADIQWMLGNVDLAHTLFRSMERLPIDLPTKRRIMVSAYATSPDRANQVREGIREYLQWRPRPGDLKGEASTQYLRYLHAAHSQDPVIAYLLARREGGLGNHEKAISMYTSALNHALPTRQLIREAHLQLAHAYRRQGVLDTARKEYERAKTLFLSKGYRSLIDDWIARCEWMAQR